MGMIVSFQVRDGVSISYDIASLKEAFVKSMEVQEVFSDKACGVCGSHDIRLNHRNVEGNDFYELSCNNHGCYAKLPYGQEKATGKIYPRRYETDAKGKAKRGADGKGIRLPNNGWAKYVPPPKDS